MPSDALAPYTPGVPDRIRRLGASAVRSYIRNRLASGPRYAQSSFQRKLGVGFNDPGPSSRARRALDFSGQVTRASAAMPVTAGAVNVIQRAVVKQRSGKRVRQKSVNFLYRLQKAVTSTAILRWQKMTEYDSNGGLNINYTRISTANQHDYPVYIFDLTSCHMSAPSSPGTVASLDATPMYRLRNSTGGNFFWTNINGDGPDAAASANWYTETSRGQNAIATEPNFGQNSMLAWSDIRLALYGATNQSTRFTVQFVQFIDQAFHPRAAPEDPAVPVVLQSNDLDQQGRFNAAMEELVKPLVFHPLHSAGNAQPVFKILSSKTFTVAPDTGLNEGKASPNVCYKLFKRMNRICKWVWQTSDKQATTTSTEHKIDPLVSMDQFPTYNQFFGGTKRPYVHPNARVYMMITAQSYTRTDISGGGSPPGPVPITAVNSPSFDVMVRNKWLYDST